MDSHEAGSRALSMAFYILCEHLERAGVLDQAELALSLDRVEMPDKPMVVENLRGLGKTLHARPFAPASFAVVEGGRD